MIIKNAEDIAKRANSTLDEFVVQYWIKLFTSGVIGYSALIQVE
jgi:hypothetical protein